MVVWEPDYVGAGRSPKYLACLICTDNWAASLSFPSLRRKGRRYGHFGGLSVRSISWKTIILAVIYIRQLCCEISAHGAGLKNPNTARIRSKILHMSEMWGAYRMVRRQSCIISLYARSLYAMALKFLCRPRSPSSFSLIGSCVIYACIRLHDATEPLHYLNSLGASLLQSGHSCWH